MRSAGWRHVIPRGASRRRVAGLAGVGLVLLAVVGLGVRWWVDSLHRVSTDDAYVAGHISPVSARISGTIAQVLVQDNQDVRAGDVLVRLDSRDREVAVAQARAAVAAARGELENARATVSLTDATTESQVRQASAGLGAATHAIETATHELEQRRSEAGAKQAAVAVARAGVTAALADFERTRLDRERMKQLVGAQLVAQQEWDHAEATYRMSQAAADAARQRLTQAEQDARQVEAAVRAQTSAVAQARQRAREAEAAVGTARSQRREVAVKRAAVAAAEGRLARAEADLQQAELNRDYTVISAPMGGRVSKKTVEIGQVVQAGQPLLALVALDDVWVIANFKETDLAGVQPGQPAVITVDAYPGVSFRAHVDSIQGGSGAVFSLLPPENATGNFVKVVQRVPVKLVIERGENRAHLLVPGMSVVPTVRFR